eukprot:2949757-Rhodomonas_salina.4
MLKDIPEEGPVLLPAPNPTTAEAWRSSSMMPVQWRSSDDHLRLGRTPAAHSATTTSPLHPSYNCPCLSCYIGYAGSHSEGYNSYSPWTSSADSETEALRCFPSVEASWQQKRTKALDLA